MAVMASKTLGEMLLAQHAGLVEPYDRPWKSRAISFVNARIAKLEPFLALGVEAIADPQRREIVREFMGDVTEVPLDHQGFNAWLLDECLGPHFTAGELIFVRCCSCSKVRTSRGLCRGPCPCGGTRVVNTTGPKNTYQALACLASGR